MYIDLIILVIANSNNIYDQFITKYWLKLINYIENNNINIKVFFLFDSIPEHININNNYIICSEQETTFIPGILKKTIHGFEYVYNNYEFKHVLRTNLSSFFIIDRLLKINNELPDNNVYAGVHVPGLVSGGGFWLSKDNIEYIIENKDNIDYNIIDDVAIFKLMKDKKITNLPRYDYKNSNNFNNELNKIKNGTHYHIRLKNGNRNNDIKFIEYLANYFY